MSDASPILYAYGPNGKPIIGTYDKIPCIAMARVHKEAGTDLPIITYTDESDIQWDEQYIHREHGERVFVDEDGRLVVESKLVWKEV